MRPLKQAISERVPGDEQRDDRETIRSQTMLTPLRTPRGALDAIVRERSGRRGVERLQKEERNAPL